MTDEAALLRAVLDRPGDETPRLVYAEWCDEYGDPARAEFIRVQVESAGLDCRCQGCGVAGSDIPSHLCLHELTGLRRRERELWARHGREWLAGDPLEKYDASIWQNRAIWNRGFIAEIRVPTLAVLLGGEACGRCNGYGHHHRNDSYRVEWVREYAPNLICAECKGERTTTGLAPAVFAAHPVTTVRVTDREPMPHGEDPDRFSWWDIDPTRDDGLGRHPPSNLPPDLFALLPGEAIDGDYKEYPSEAAALDALSAALVNMARERAGLAPLTGPTGDAT